MSEESASSANLRIAQEIQTKFEFWLIGLIFAVLALAVQTATFDGAWVGQVCELAAWVALLTAGVIGVQRLEWTPPLFHLASRKASQEAALSEVQKLKVSGAPTILVTESGERQDLSSFVSAVQGNIKSVDEQLLPLNRRHRSRYRWMRSLLIAGFALLLIARGYDPACGLVRSWTTSDRAAAQTKAP